MAEFLHKKPGSSLWYYRRRYPQDVTKVLGKATYMQSLKTTVKREAERLSRGVSVQFDAICHEARQRRELALAAADSQQSTNGCVGDLSDRADEVLAGIPALVRKAASRVIEEQLHNPRNWLDVVKGWKMFYEAMRIGAVPNEAQRPAMEAQAILNGFELAIQGKPLPPQPVAESSALQRSITALSGNTSCEETWTALCDRALREYQHKVSLPRYKLAQSKLAEVKAAGCTELEIQEGLRGWCKGRLLEVKPRTVKVQLDCMVSALRCILPKLTAPVLRELQGVMQPRLGDRQSMPVQEIRLAVKAFKNKPVPAKVRNDYDGGASQFDAIAVEVLAVLGMRPSELVKARPNSLVRQVDVFNKGGVFLRLVDGKNKASEREIPLSDGIREVLPIQQLREMLEWQEKNARSRAGTVTSLGTRFKAMTNGYTLYQMRHSWKDLAVHAGVDSELRERLMGHKVPGISAVYGSGIPLEKGLDALMLIRGELGFD